MHRRSPLVVGVLALQGAFKEHLDLLHQATEKHDRLDWTFIEVRTQADLQRCDALIIPGGESTTMAVVAARSHLLEPLREFVKHPVWGTCAGLILLAESANRTKRGGQDLIGGIDVRVNRNHFGRQVESFETDLDLPFLARGCATDAAIAPQQPFKAVFIRAPVVERILSPRAEGARDEEAQADDASVIAPPRIPEGEVAARLAVQEVEIMATVRPRGPSAPADAADAAAGRPKGDIVAVRQGNVFATSFHPELTGDPRIHTWWLQEVLELAERAQKGDPSTSGEVE